MRRLSVALAVVALGAASAALVAGATSATGTSVTVTIRHQLAHCHTWSVNGGPFRAAQKVTVSRGTAVTFTNDDVMPHRLVQLAGPTVAMRNVTSTGMGMHGSSSPGLMGSMGSSTRITFIKPGLYRFRTHPGEDYMAGVKTTGEDNVLTLSVAVR